MKPEWRTRPDGPGIWVALGSRGVIRGRLEVLRLTPNDIERGAPFDTAMVYGPLPEPPEEMMVTVETKERKA